MICRRIFSGPSSHSRHHSHSSHRRSPHVSVPTFILFFNTCGVWFGCERRPCRLAPSPLLWLQFTESCIYYFMCDREDACLSWLLFLFFAKWTWKHFIGLIWWLCTHERPWTVHTQFAKHGRILLLLNLQVLSRDCPSCAYKHLL